MAGASRRDEPPGATDRERIHWLYARQIARARERTGRDDLFMHFGHWDDPAHAVTDEAGFLAAQHRLNDALLALAELRDGARVVDVGCGLGGTIAEIDRRFAGLELHGVNIDPAQIDVCRRRVVDARNRIDWHVASALALPLPDASVDVVLAVECIPHFGDRAAFLREASRVALPGGRIVLSDFVPSRELAAMRRDGRLPAGFERAVVDGLGPWDDFWGEGPNVIEHAGALGLTVEAHHDATTEVLPTVACMLREPLEPSMADLDLDPKARGVAALGWALRTRLLSMVYVALVRGD